MFHGFWNEVFDAEFQEFIVPRITRSIYIAGMIGIFFLMLIGMIDGIVRLVTGDNEGLLWFFLSLSLGILAMLALRIFSELIVVQFRIANDTRTIAKKLREEGDKEK